MNKRVRLTIVAIVVSLFISLYFLVNPATSRFVPKCIFKMLTGHDCPACGGQRVFHSLLHGELKEALLLNPFLFIVAPYLLAILYASISKSRFATTIKPYLTHYITISIYFAICVLWWIVRNTDWWHTLIQG